MPASVVAVRKRVANDRTTLKGTILEYVATYQVEFSGVDYLLPQALFASDGTITVPSSGTMSLTTGGITWTLYYKGSDGRREEGIAAEVFVTWSSDPEYQPTTPSGDDGKRNIQITVDGVAYEEGVNRDKDGKVIVNAAGDPFPADIKRTLYDEKISVSWTADSVDTGAVADLRGKINTSAITMTIGGQSRTFAAKTVKLAGCTIKKTIQADDTGFDCSLELLYRKDGWKAKITDQGYHYLDDSGNKIKPVDREGNETNELVFLTSDGKKLDTSGGPVDAHMVEAEIELDANLASLLTGIS